MSKLATLSVWLVFVAGAAAAAAVVGDDTEAAGAPQYYNYATNGSNNSYPFNIHTGKQVQMLFLPGEFDHPVPAPAGTIETLYFRISDTHLLGPWVYTDFAVRMGQADITEFTAGEFYPGALTTVYSRSSVTLSASTGTWLALQLDAPFAYDPARSLIVNVSQCAALGAVGYSACYTPRTGGRRIWSVGGCPFSYSSADNFVYHAGISLGPILFSDGFESGGCTGWSVEVPCAGRNRKESASAAFPASPSCSGRNQRARLAVTSGNRLAPQRLGRCSVASAPCGTGTKCRPATCRIREGGSPLQFGWHSGAVQGLRRRCP